MKKKIIILAMVAGVLGMVVVQLAVAFINVYVTPIPSLVFVLLGAVVVILLLMLAGIVNEITKEW